MRVKRLKHCKKHIVYYKTNFGFREPYQVLVDLTFCQHALMYKINIKEQLPKYIDGNSQLFTTECILAEGKMLGPQLHGAVLVGSQFKLRKCSHKTPVTAQECIKSLIGTQNTNHFFIASQDSELRNKLRKIPGVPLLHIHYNALVLEKPSTTTIKASDKIDHSKTQASEVEKKRLTQLKKLHAIDEPTQEKTFRKKFRKKGVNPLAMKKKKKKDTVIPSSTDSSKKRKRKKQKIANYVGELRKQENKLS